MPFDAHKSHEVDVTLFCGCCGQGSEKRVDLLSRLDVNSAVLSVCLHLEVYVHFASLGAEQDVHRVVWGWRRSGPDVLCSVDSTSPLRLSSLKSSFVHFFTAAFFGGMVPFTVLSVPGPMQSA